ncbi:MAG: MFS transporter [Proteobacteria bacterium]|nr:MFS transporter [Pseudomonadota bacterium]
MSSPSGNLYRFIGLHSFLIGLFPFYIPVFLWKTGTSIGEISLFISLTGVGFCITLWIWDRLHKKVGLNRIIALSFLLEAGLLAMIFFREYSLLIPLLALLNGAYNCFFWTTQRVLFLDIILPNTSGRKFGNLQILAAILLKSGIFVGGILLDTFGFGTVFIFSSIVVISSVILISSYRNIPGFSSDLIKTRPIGFKEIYKFKDSLGSRFVFIIDGLFLFLESYFWLISIFLIVKESFLGLGVMIIVLMLTFTLLFWLIKNSIDRLPREITFKLSVLLYAVSWVFRGIMNENLESWAVILLLVLIAFFTSFFRLTFNKRFFDLAKESSSHGYLILKSYYSQASVAVLFGIIGFFLFDSANTESMISRIYFISALIAVGYLIYGKKDQVSNLHGFTNKPVRHPV